jgi:probable phosphoglycerate mutase
MTPSSIEKVVYFVRHGQSEGNITPVFQSVESQLTDQGREQAKAMAQRVARLSFEALIASPQSRARGTAEAIVQKTGKSLEFSELFIERTKPTALNGKAYDDEEADHLWKLWERSLYTPGLRAEDGENFDDIILRAEHALDYLLKRPEKELVVVTHGYFMRTIIAHVLLGTSLTGEAFKSFQDKISMENTGISVLRYGTAYEGTAWRLWIFNDHSHLG